MVKDGAITKDQLTLKGLKKYFDEHPSDMDKYLALNERFVFFTEPPRRSLRFAQCSRHDFCDDRYGQERLSRAMPGFLSTQIPADASGSR